MGLLDLVKEHHGVGLAPHLLRQLARVVVTHIAGGGADDPGDGVFFHVLGHIQADQGVGGVEQVGGQLLYQLRFAHAGGTYKDEGHGLVLGADAHPAAADGGGHSGYGLVLTNHMGLQPVLQLGQPLIFLLLDLAGGNIGPQLDHIGQMGGGEHGLPLLQKAVPLGLEPQLHAADGGQTLIGIVCGGGGHDLFLFVQVGQLLVHLGQAGQIFVVEVHIGAGLVQQVDGLVRQISVGNVPLAHGDGQTAHLLGDRHLVEAGVIGSDPLQNTDAVGDGGFLHQHGLEAALQGGVLLDVLAVLRQSGGADDLNLPPGQSGLEDIGGVHRALGVSCAYDGVYLVDHQDDVADLADLLDQALHAAFKLAAELGAGDQGGEIQKVDLLVQKLIGDLFPLDGQSKALGDGGFAHAGLANQTGVVFLAAVQDLDDPLDLAFAAHQLVQLALPGLFGQGDAVVVQILPLGPLGGAGLVTPGRGRFAGFGLLRGGVGAEKLVEEGEGGGASGVVLVLAALLLGVEHGGQGRGIPQGGSQVLRQLVDVIVAYAQLAEHIIDRLYAQLLGAFQTEPLAFGLAVFQLGNEDDRYVFAAAGT